MRSWAILLLMLMFSLAGCFGDDDENGGDDGDDAMDGNGGTGGTGGSGGTGGTGGTGGGGSMDMGDDGDDGDGGLPCGGIADADRAQVSVTIAAVGLFPANPALDPARVELPQCARVTLTYNNEDLNPLIGHDVVSPPLGLQTAVIDPGQSVTVEFNVDVPAGEYPFYCAVGNHRDMGMEGVFVVS